MTRSRVSWITPAAGASSGRRNLACKCVDARRESIDRFRAIENADLDVVHTSFARSEMCQLAPLSSIETPCVAIGGRLHGDAVRSFAEHPPHRMEWELALLVDLVGAEAYASVDDGYRHGSTRLRDDVVFVTLLSKSFARPCEPPVITSRILGHGDTWRRGDQVLGSLVDDGPAHIHVVQAHMGRRVEASVDDLVVHCEPALADPRLDSPAQFHRFTVDRRLADDSFGPQHAFVAVPT